MSRLKVLILGSTGFVGANMVDVLTSGYTVFGTSRCLSGGGGNTVAFDFEDRGTWSNIVLLQPDVVINVAGYGVIKTQRDQHKMKMINYYLPSLLKEYLDECLTSYFWIQIGTAFEYDLDRGRLTEESPTLPLTDYGISKLLFSKYLFHGGRRNFALLRPFATFGPGEDASKIIPALILSQINNTPIDLSDGGQQRDYFYVKDLAAFIGRLLGGDLSAIMGVTINVGSSTAISLKELAGKVSIEIPRFDHSLWRWGNVDRRRDEGVVFYNGSLKCRELGFEQTPFETAIRQTIKYYYQGAI